MLHNSSAVYSEPLHSTISRSKNGSCSKAATQSGKHFDELLAPAYLLKENLKGERKELGVRSQEQRQGARLFNPTRIKCLKFL